MVLLTKNLIPQERIENKIYLLRGKKVMFDRDVAELYGVATRVLNQAVKRNKDRFPEDFMFQLTNLEMEDWKSQIVISNKERMGLRKRPLVFTEQGVAMPAWRQTGFPVSLIVNALFKSIFRLCVRLRSFGS